MNLDRDQFITIDDYFHLHIIDIDDCQPMPCKHNGSCRDGINSYTCKCAAGYEGKDCEKSKFIVSHLLPFAVQVCIIIVQH